MNNAARQEAERLWPNHTYARGQFLKGAAWMTAGVDELLMAVSTGDLNFEEFVDQLTDLISG
jgi:hypothetical protein